MDDYRDMLQKFYDYFWTHENFTNPGMPDLRYRIRQMSKPELLYFFGMLLSIMEEIYEKHNGKYDSAGGLLTETARHFLRYAEYCKGEPERKVLRWHCPNCHVVNRTFLPDDWEAECDSCLRRHSWHDVLPAEMMD